LYLANNKNPINGILDKIIVNLSFSEKFVFSFSNQTKSLDSFINFTDLYKLNFSLECALCIHKTKRKNININEVETIISFIEKFKILKSKPKNKL
jgi:hypothetical protein